MASEVSICNRALQLVGSDSITSLTDDSTAARECARCYEELRDAELAANPWTFASRQYSLAASTTAPEFTYDNSFVLPAGVLSVRHNSEPEIDWVLFSTDEGTAIYTNYAAPLEVVCIMQVTDPNRMHVLFREALAARIGVEICERLAQSERVQQKCERAYIQAVRTARRCDAIQKLPTESVEDYWLTVRR